jgi:hypothetical protein
MFQSYDTYDAAVTAWQTHCEVNGYDKEYFQAGLFQHGGHASTSHMPAATTVTENHAVEPQGMCCYSYIS